MAVTIRVCKSFRIEASHIIPNHPGKCRNLHGHSYVFDVWAEAPIDPSTGMVMDFSVLGDLAEVCILKYDHTHLNDSMKLELPTAENIAAKVLKAMFLLDGRVRGVRVHETHSSFAEVTITDDGFGIAR